MMVLQSSSMRDFQRVDLVVVVHDRAAQLEVAGHERLDRELDLLLDQAAHLQHARAQRLQFGVELLGSVFG